MKLSVVIPAYNEEENIIPTLENLTSNLDGVVKEYEIVVVNDNSTDKTKEVVEAFQNDHPQVVLVHRTPPGGFGRAIRSGLAAVTGDVVCPFMADSSDDPKDLIVYYNKILEGYDCVYGSRFMHGSEVRNYPTYKLVVNRIVNKALQVLFITRHNDLTNAFKAYRRDVVEASGPFLSSHFNITVEMSLAALIRGYSIATVPISWSVREKGVSNLKLREMGRRYLSVIIRLLCERVLIGDDIIAEKIKNRPRSKLMELENKMETLESRIRELEDKDS